MSASGPRTVKFIPSPGLREAYRHYKNSYPEIKATIEIFNENKSKIPPVALPPQMKDHALQGALAGFRECHLNGRNGDILLIYTHENDTVKMLAICQHDDLYGKKGTVLKKTLKKQSENM